MIFDCFDSCNIFNLFYIEFLRTSCSFRFFYNYYVFFFLILYYAALLGVSVYICFPMLCSNRIHECTFLFYSFKYLLVCFSLYLTSFPYTFNTLVFSFWHHLLLMVLYSYVATFHMNVLINLFLILRCSFYDVDTLYFLLKADFANAIYCLSSWVLLPSNVILPLLDKQFNFLS